MIVNQGLILGILKYAGKVASYDLDLSSAKRGCPMCLLRCRSPNRNIAIAILCTSYGEFRNGT